MSSPQDKTIDLQQYVRMLWRRRGVILLCTVATFCAALVALTFVPNQYDSEVALLIEESRVLSHDLEQLMGGVMTSPKGYGVDEERMAKLVGRIRSRPFLERVVRMLRMHEDQRIRSLAEQARAEHPTLGVDAEEMAIRILVDNLQERIRFSSTGPGIYRVLVADHSATGAQLLARWISELFVDVSKEDALDRLRAAHEFGTRQLALYEERLRESEAALERHRTGQIERSLSPRLVWAENLDLAELLYRRIVDEAARQRARMRSDSLALSERGMQGSQSALLADASVRELSASLATALRNEVGNRLATGSANGNDWAPLSAYAAPRGDLLRRVEVAAARYFPAAPGDALAAMASFVFSKLDLAAQLEAQALLRRAIDAYKRQAGATPGGEIELERLENDVEENRRLLQSFQSQLVASDVSQAVELTKLGLHIQILDPPRLPLSPSYPQRAKTLIAALLLGLLVGAVFAFIAETTDPVMRSADDFAKVIPEPVLGTIPLLDRVVDRRPWMRRYWVAVALAGIIVLAAAAFLMRDGILRSLGTVTAPIQMVDPERNTR